MRPIRPHPLFSIPSLSLDMLMIMSQSQIVIHSKDDLLLRSQIPFCCLNRGMPQQKLDLLEVAAVFPA
jgi:hypothetical protein